LLLSHGAAVQAIRASGCTVPLGLVLNLSPFHPASAAVADLDKTRIEDGLLVRWYLDPVLKGSYPADVLAHLQDDAPVIADGDLALIATPVDFIGVNYYTRSVVSAAAPWSAADQGLAVTDMGWEIYPDGLRELLVRLHEDYPMPAIFITENGAAFADKPVDGAVFDADRIRYLQDHLQATLSARSAGVDIRGYFVWSLLDNFEWASGYAKRFGLVYVDYLTQQRIPKASAIWYKNFLSDK
jgi:beta-glucosidase